LRRTEHDEAGGEGQKREDVARGLIEHRLVGCWVDHAKKL
jgi:hypothetical protein